MVRLHIEASLFLTTLALFNDASAKNCTRAMLQEAADSYVAAQAAGIYSNIKWLSNTVTYNENNKTADITKGILSQALVISHNRSTLDTTQCATYTELIIVDPKNPTVSGTQMRFNGSNITKIESIVTHKGDWAFNATTTLIYATPENWGIIPVEKRDTRATIQAAADAYLDLFNNASVVVPWGTPCARLEGGMYLNGNCDLGVPSGIPMTNRRYVIDETVGTVDVMLMLDGAPGMPDSHEYRIEGGKIRYVHTMSVNVTHPAGI
ncbi:hypothetical protein L207DRAFT_609804 [Hyaloscypha variabilis F]|uniref:DUF8021 domain-containing protein n=1 Tax=Hyaloscypha variabilis (strain UAMH 11265 / GT02V1 / F) TaxID=1149755 RepID=A0A2J6R1Q2_HYAVF|nr:hypothetical protein L207DRAFT_609804 [Hyaloscypha variabilis F]